MSGREQNTRNSWSQHHAVLFVGDMELSERVVRHAHGTEDGWGGDPDLVYLSFESLSIADAHALRTRAYQLPVQKDVVTFVIRAHDITREAQNALLKLFEDPPRTARFRILVPLGTPILDTLKSRFFLVASREQGNSTTPLPALDSTASVLEKVKDDDAYRAMIRRAFANARDGSATYDDALLSLELFTDTKGASQKMLIEHALISYYESRNARVAKGSRHG